MINRGFKFPKWHVPPLIVHTLVWIFVYMIPFVFMPYGNENAWRIRYITSVPFLIFILSFYANYSYLIDKFLFSRRFAVYIAINLAMFLILSFFINLWRNHIIELGVLALPPKHPKLPFGGLFQDILGFTFINGIAVAVRSTTLWFASKSQIHELEAESVRSELLFLKMQISPHFLFNTLNNILSLIDENKELAKKSVMQLSNMLRSVLYYSEADIIAIRQEVEFLTDYSSLMRLRYGPELKFNLETDLQEPEAPIAPLLLIPIMENMFKHGIGSSVEKSFINIKISSEKGKIVFEGINTYLPKTSQDKSGGIGIASTRKRLDLLYENRYTFDCKITGENYITKLELHYDTLHRDT